MEYGQYRREDGYHKKDIDMCAEEQRPVPAGTRCRVYIGDRAQSCFFISKATNKIDEGRRRRRDSKDIRKMSPIGYMDDIVGGRDAEGKELSADAVRAFLKKHHEKGNLPYGPPASVSANVPFCGRFAPSSIVELVFNKYQRRMTGLRKLKVPIYKDTKTRMYPKTHSMY